MDSNKFRSHQGISAIKPAEKRKVYFDNNTDGLGLRVTPKGTKTFFYRYRFGGKLRRFTIGRFGDVSLKEARKKVTELRADINNGTDPQAEKKKRRYKPKELTFKELSDLFSKRHLPKLKKRTRDEYQRIIDVELIDKHKWGDIQVSEITSQHVREVLNNKAYEEDAFTMANRMRSTISKMFEFGLTHVGLNLETNPVENTPVFEQGENVVDRVYNEDEIQELWEYWETRPEPIQSYYKFLLLTGQRRTETMQMRWDDIQEDKPCKKIEIGKDGRPKPKAFLADIWTKPDTKGNRPHELPLSDKAKEVLENLKEVTGDSEYVFQSPIVDNQPLNSVKGTSRNIKKKTSVSDFKLHDLRRTLNTNLEMVGVDEIVRKKILNHKAEGVTEKHYSWYNYTDKKLEALQRWGWRVEAIVSGETEEAKITKIR